MTSTGTHTHGVGMRVTVIVLSLLLAAMTALFLITAAKLDDGATRLNDGAAKAQLLTIFDALKPTDPIVLKGRRRLSSMIFA